jgi:hypothetical protein
MGFTADFVPSMESLKQVRRLLRGWLASRLAASAVAWLDEEAEGAREGPEKRLFLAFSAAGRHAPKTPLGLSESERAQADRVRPRWEPDAWTREEAARTYLLLQRDSRNRDRWLREITMLFEHADLGEQVALYRALPVLPNPDALVDRCAEGIRSNVTDVFRAVAHRNPYPSENLPDAAWNQMVLKALFVEAGLAGVVGLAERGNPALARMLCDYAKERWAAGRTVPAEMWSVVGPHADSGGVEVLDRALTTGDDATKAAAAAALRQCPWPEASYVLSRHGLLSAEDLL